LSSQSQNALPLFRAAGITSIEQLNDIYRRSKPWAEYAIRKVGEETSRLGWELHAGPVDPLVILVAADTKSKELLATLEDSSWVEPGILALRNFVQQSAGNMPADTPVIEAEFRDNEPAESPRVSTTEASEKEVRASDSRLDGKNPDEDELAQESE
jgi:hypothetical protein